jgi:hypothetical protein
MNELERLGQLKQEAINNPLKKKKGCSNCKKKVDQPVEALPEVIEVVIEPTVEDVKLALDLMVGKPSEKDHQFINWVYRSFFNENTPIGCGSCGATAERKLRHRYNLMRGIKG